jgi:hypothetical protein
MEVRSVEAGKVKDSNLARLKSRGLSYPPESSRNQVVRNGIDDLASAVKQFALLGYPSYEHWAA